MPTTNRPSRRTGIETPVLLKLCDETLFGSMTSIYYLRSLESEIIKEAGERGCMVNALFHIIL